MKIKWWLENGYSGNRQLVTDISDSVILACETEEEVYDLIREHIRFTFESEVNYGFDLQEALSKAQELRSKSVELDK